MSTGICPLGMAAVRSAPGHKNEMVSQLLFGESFDVIEAAGDWLHIAMGHDQYRGWVAANQVELLDEENLKRLRSCQIVVTAGYMTEVVEELSGRRFPVSAGSTLYMEAGGRFVLNGISWGYHGEVLGRQRPSLEHITLHARLFLGTPYLWGGRSAFGTDCSGFVQTVFHMAGIKLPRDASVQANLGESVHLVHEARAGDLLFFDDPAGDINHVGIYLGEGEVIHAHGRVRTDRIDHQGIFNTGTRRYTHPLRLIRRISPFKRPGPHQLI